jgi:hypothetical protein
MKNLLSQLPPGAREHNGATTSTTTHHGRLAGGQQHRQIVDALGIRVNNVFMRIDANF